MSLILNIDTAVSLASVCLARQGDTIQLAENENPQNHALWLHKAIDLLMKKENVNFSDLDAIAVTNGPGSYTGLRVGLSAAKGLCYALNIPLITIGTLEVMAYAAKEEPVDLFCPMIDARRLEVFTALFDKELNVVVPPHALIITEECFQQFYLSGKILFFGNGAPKMKSILKQDILSLKNILFKQVSYNASSMSFYSYDAFNKKSFADIYYCEPTYLKNFYSNSSKNILE